MKWDIRMKVLFARWILCREHESSRHNYLTTHMFSALSFDANWSKWRDKCKRGEIKRSVMVVSWMFKFDQSLVFINTSSTVSSILWRFVLVYSGWEKKSLELGAILDCRGVSYSLFSWFYTLSTWYCMWIQSSITKRNKWCKEMKNWNIFSADQELRLVSSQSERTSSKAFLRLEWWCSILSQFHKN